MRRLVQRDEASHTHGAQAGARVSLGRTYCDPGMGWFGPNQSETFTVLSDGRSYDALSLADVCLTLWETALRRHGHEI
jgi:hypothetical protein